MLDGNDPAARSRYIQAYGPAAYEKAMAEFFERSTVATENGYPIRRVESGRFGTLYMVDGLNRGYKTLDGARQLARAAPSNEAK